MKTSIRNFLVWGSWGIIPKRSTKFLFFALVLFVFTLSTSCKSTSTGSTPTPGAGTGTNSWAGISGSLSGGAWHAAARIDSGGVPAGDYANAFYAPNGDLYVFFTQLVSSAYNLEVTIRRVGTSTWTSPLEIVSNSRTANAYFESSSNVYLAMENSGTVGIMHSANSGAAWTFVTSYAASGNGSQNPAFGQAFLTPDGSFLNLLFTYADWNPVIGGTDRGFQIAGQTGSGWPTNSTPIIDSISNSTLDSQGAFQDKNGNILFLGLNAYRSTNSGSSFNQVMNSGVAANDLTGVVAAGQHFATGDIFVGNYYLASSGNLSIYGTADYGATFYKLNTFSPLSQPPLAKIAAAQNLVVVVASNTTNQYIFESHSYDGGLTWSSWTNIVDVSANNWTLDNIGLSVDAVTGKASLTYSAQNNTASAQGVYLMEFY